MLCAIHPKPIAVARTFDRLSPPMELTLAEAAAQMGKSPRQVRYLIKQGRLPARKRGNAWCIDSKDIPRSDAQIEAGIRKRAQLRAAVDDALDPSGRSGRRRYSFTQLRASQIALPLYRRAANSFGPEHPAVQALHGVVEHLARGCHRFARNEKADAYRAARDEASRAACSLAIVEQDEAEPLLEVIEQELMGALVGLLRRNERRGRP